jgi:Raf kinase inhibitor-like YbhB/YbcL family protein
VLTTTFVLLMVAGGCRHDGRTLRPAKSDQFSSVSTTAPPSTDDPAFIDPDSTDALSTVATFTTLPPAGSALVATAPWRDGAEIDARYTCDGLNVAPALSWSAAPAGTVEIAITLTDLDAPGFVHWVIAGISPLSIALNEDTVPLDAYEATNGSGDIGYTGPCPPAGSPHHYVITVHYLGAPTGLDDGTPAAELINAIDSAETASAEVNGTFSRT